jgi:hypothetical protein
MSDKKFQEYLKSSVKRSVPCEPVGGYANAEETFWGKSINALIKLLLPPRRICWLFYNNTTKMLGATIKKLFAVV